MSEASLVIPDICRTREPISMEEREVWLASSVCNKCMCFNIPFQEIIDYNKATGKTLEEIMKICKVGTDCEVCLPYIRRALETGNPDIRIDAGDTDMWEPSPNQGVPKADLRDEGLVHKPIPSQHSYLAPGTKIAE